MGSSWTVLIAHIKLDSGCWNFFLSHSDSQPVEESVNQMMDTSDAQELFSVTAQRLVTWIEAIIE